MWCYLKQTSVPNQLVKVPSAAIAEANHEVEVLQEAQKSQVGLKQEPYYHFMQEGQAEIGKYAAEYGTAAAVRKFDRRTMVTKPLDESTVRELKSKYEDTLKKKKRTKKRGRLVALSPLQKSWFSPSQYLIKKICQCKAPHTWMF